MKHRLVRIRIQVFFTDARKERDPLYGLKQNYFKLSELLFNTLKIFIKKIFLIPILSMFIMDHQ